MSAHTTTASVLIGAVAVATLAYPFHLAIQSDRPSARPFAVVLAATALWAVCTVVPALPGVPTAVTSAGAWETGADVGSFGVPVAWVVYARRYTGRNAWRSPGVVGLAIIAAVSIVVTNLSIPRETPASIATGLIIFVTIVAVLVAFSYGTWLLYRLARAHVQVSAWQVATVMGAVATPYLIRIAVGAWALTRFAIADIPVERSLAAIPISELPVGFLVAGACATVGVRRYPVLAGFPRGNAAARATIARDLREPVIVLDYDGQILDMNDSAAETFDWDPSAVLGRSLATVEPELEGLGFSERHTDSVWVTTGDGRRRFQYSASPVGRAARDGEPIAKALLLRDVTDRRTREQRLQVLNRVLRHNIRNNIDVVLAHAGEIEDPTVRERIRDTAQELASLGTKAREAERTLAATSEPPNEVDLVATLTDIINEYDTEMADVTFAAPSDLSIVTHEPVIRTVVGELLENAIGHAREPPTVEITLAETEEGVELTVADDGPGIPDHDRKVLERGIESQLSHVTGLGLWLVQWAVTHMGGDIRLADREPTGTVVTITLYT